MFDGKDLLKERNQGALFIALSKWKLDKLIGIKRENLGLITHSTKRVFIESFDIGVLLIAILPSCLPSLKFNSFANHGILFLMS